MSAQLPDIVMVDSRVLLRPGRIMKLLAIFIMIAILIGDSFEQPRQFVVGELVGAVAMAIGLVGDALRRTRNT